MVPGVPFEKRIVFLASNEFSSYSVLFPMEPRATLARFLEIPPPIGLSSGGYGDDRPISLVIHNGERIPPSAPGADVRDEDEPVTQQPVKA